MVSILRCVYGRPLSNVLPLSCEVEFVQNYYSAKGFNCLTLADYSSIAHNSRFTKELLQVRNILLRKTTKQKMRCEHSKTLRCQGVVTTLNKLNCESREGYLVEWNIFKGRPINSRDRHGGKNCATVAWRLRALIEQALEGNQFHAHRLEAMVLNTH